MSAFQPRATRLHRQAQHTVVSSAIPVAAARDHPSMVRMPSRNGPVPTRHTSTARMAAAHRRAHLHQVRLIVTSDLLGTPSAPGRPVDLTADVAARSRSAVTYVDNGGNGSPGRPAVNAAALIVAGPAGPGGAR